MKDFRTLLAIMLAAGFAAPALADCDGKRSALSDFGAAALGDPYTKLPRDVTRLPYCEVYGNKYADCELLDKFGVSYIVLGDFITRKNILVNRTSRPAQLPFGLLPTDTIGQVVKKITTRSDAPDLYILYAEQQFHVSSGLCVTNERGEFALDFVFDNNEKLQEISVLLDSPAN